MSLDVECGLCHRAYRVKEEMIGRRVRCKACGGEFIVTAPASSLTEQQWAQDPVSSAAAPVLPPPMLSLTAPVPPPMQFQSPQGYLPFPPASQAKSSAGKVIVILGAVLLLLAGAGAIFGHLKHIGALPAIFLSDEELQPKLVGTWTITHSANGPVTGTIAFGRNYTYHARLNAMSFGGRYTLKHRQITMVISGRKGTRTNTLGTIKQLTNTDMVLATDSGNETYHKNR